MFSDTIQNLPVDRMDAWLDAFLTNKTPPLYSSVDIRISSTQVGVVDANLFPAGFNNIHPDDHTALIQALSDHIQEYHKAVSHIVLISEEHTRNTWYLENIYQLAHYLGSAGYSVTIATFLDDDPDYCATTDRVVLATAKGNQVTLRCLHHLLIENRNGLAKFDLAILNNDLTSGLPAVLDGIPFPVIPSPLLGWHQRRKSNHFKRVHQIADQMATELGFSAQLITCQHRVVESVDITNDADRDRLAFAVDGLIDQIASRSTPTDPNRPLVFLKSDSGTYGMGVVAVSSAQDVTDLNRKNRNKLAKGKGSAVISQFIIQEGIPSDLRIDGDVGEICAYQIGSKTVGAFYRLNKSKSGRDNLNSQGMHFLPISWSSQEESDADQLFLKRLCQVLAKLSVSAICLEMESV